MIAFINNVVAGAGVTLLINALAGPGHLGLALGGGALTVILLMALFLTYQRWRFGSLPLAMRPSPPAEAERSRTNQLPALTRR